MSTPWGRGVRVRIRANDGRALTWGECYEAWSDAYPDRWAFQLFPPRSDLLDETNTYHLVMLEEGATVPDSLNLRLRPW